MTYIERTPESYVGVRPVDPATERAVLLMFFGLPERRLGAASNPEPSTIERLRALKRGEAELVLSTARPTAVIAAAMAGRSAVYRYERKGARSWIVERTA